MAMTINPPDVYSHVLNKIFSGQIKPGSRLVERQLADELGVSRVPVRETLMRLVAQGVLVGGEKGQGVRVREYTHTEVRQLYQFREMIEGGAAFAAAQSRSEDDLLALDMICQQMEAQKPKDYDAILWGQLDHQFHKAMAAASHQERFIQEMQTLLAETHFVFFNLKEALVERPSEPVEDLMQRVVKEHRQIIDMIRQGNAEAAEQAARVPMRQSANRATQNRIASQFTAAQPMDELEASGEFSELETKELQYAY